MMKIINTVSMLEQIFPQGIFDFKKWQIYIEKVLPNNSYLLINDMNQMIAKGNFQYEQEILPILNLVYTHKKEVKKAIDSFYQATSNLEEKIMNKFGKSMDVDIILYLGLCNGAGWVVKIEDRQTILLGIEKIIELEWYDLQSILGLIYHELGHVYQMQYGVLERNLTNNKEQFIWQLFVEGIAMAFEQILMDDPSFFHQDRNGWLVWCEEHKDQIKIDFYLDLETMTDENQRYFGDWVLYHNQPDVGYYLGSKFIWFLLKQFKLDEIITFDIDDVAIIFNQFIINPKEKP